MPSRIYIFIFILCLAFTTPFAQASEPVDTTPNGSLLRIAAARSLSDPGLVDFLVERFLDSNPTLRVEVLPGGALTVLEYGRIGKADLVITHYPPEEKRYLELGYASERIEFMRSHFALFGPPGDPLGLRRADNFKEALRLLKDGEADMLSPSPRSGTYRKLEELWASAGIEPNWMAYENTGSSARATLRQAAQFGAYVLADLGLYLAEREQLNDTIQPLFRDDLALRNEFSAMLANPTQAAGVRTGLADRFLDFLISAHGQIAIREFSEQRFGAPLYEPTAHQDEAVVARRLQAQIEAERLSRLLWTGATLFITLLTITIMLLIRRARRLERERWGKSLELEQEKQARALAEYANQAKTKFLSRMSHELRTPLNAIMGFAQLNQRPAISMDALKEYNALILAASSHLLELINELLDLSHIESSRFSLDLQPVDPLTIAQECLRMTQASADEKQLQVTLEASGSDQVLADPKRLRQVMLNLLSNAIKYNRTGGLIDIKLTAVKGHRMQIAISDSGCGIPTSDLDRLFQPFERLSDDPNTEGTGLGLVISKSLIELMGGSIGVTSQQGEGSTFSIELSLAGQEQTSP